jgi:hypothetical protein
MRYLAPIRSQPVISGMKAEYWKLLKLFQCASPRLPLTTPSAFFVGSAYSFLFYSRQTMSQRGFINAKYLLNY